MVALVAPAVATAQQPVTILHAFGIGADGIGPNAALVQATDGNFYGTTVSGGASNSGTVFKMTVAGAVTVLHDFTSGTSDGSYPNASLIQGTDGNFYGTTYYGGGVSTCPNCGTVFKMTPTGVVTILYAFGTGGTTDGANPDASLIQAADGNFYGTTAYGGALSDGTVFRMTPAGTLTVLHSFTGGTDGAHPSAALIQATSGNFYGTTFGQNGPQSTVFVMTPTGSVTGLHDFTGGTDGAPPTSLIQAADGNFYGTTATAGAYGDGTFGDGTVFKMTAAGTVTVLHVFTALTDGGGLNAALIQATDGNFYGMTQEGGASNVGTVFSMTPAGAFTVRHVFVG
jgi:uncharacterized repeat protein (TIGR03803 family)